MNIRKFHIYLADLSPRFGSEPGKTRPVVVVQTNLLNSIHPSTIICPLTTNIIRKSNILRVHLSSKQSILKKASDILVDQIRAIDNRRFIKETGFLTTKQQQLLMENLKILIFE